MEKCIYPTEDGKEPKAVPEMLIIFKHLAQEQRKERLGRQRKCCDKTESCHKEIKSSGGQL